MAEIRFIPADASDAGGAWVAAVTPGAAAVLAASVTPQTAEAVWRRLDGGGIGALVEALTGAFGTSLTAIPSFALVLSEEDGIRVAVRGPIDVLVEGPDGAVEVSGRGVATWAERTVPRAGRARVSFGGDHDESLSLPIASGVVPVSGLVLTAGARAVAATPAPVPASVAESAPASVAESAPAAAPAALPPTPAASPAPLSLPPVPGPPPLPPTLLPASDTPPPTSALPSELSEPAGSDTWIPATTQHPVDDAPGDLADDSTIAAPRGDAGSWAATVARAPLRTPGDVAPVPAPVAGDHDGETVSVAQARALRAAGGAAASFEPVGDVPPRQPTQGRIRLSTGRVVELERPVVIGRRPRSTRASSSELPLLVAVESAEGDISRSHVEIRAEGEHVLVTDLATTNGTVLRRGGQDPVRLHPNEPTMVVTGDVLDLGDGITVTFEDLP
ncbi:FHA domain-containing protein [Microbacterium sp.]|uniref:FHA domain-containing protein n=1 Tax=Microbacterium sp. TaxID=51671 RepID=UPI0039E67F16